MKFHKVSYEQFEKDILNNIELDEEESVEDFYNNIILPKRGTAHAAGYDFVSPFDIEIPANMHGVIPTGIRFESDSDKFLEMLPRSGHGCKYGIRLRNTAGIIDADYFNADNEGHIMIMLENTGHETYTLKAGERFCQGIIQSYWTVEDDDTTDERTGGFGSTGK